jgi:tetratricopeptide (TPR) repeat protein
MLRKLLTEWGFKFEHEKLDNAEKQLEKIKGSLELLAAAEVVKGIAELTERFAHFAEELHVAATSAGITVEAFQKLAFAAGQSAVSQEEMEHSMTRLTRNLYEARKGGEEAQKVFADAGFTQDQIAGFKTGSDVLYALADKFKTIQDPIKKQAVAMELMGRGSIHMVGFLSQGSAAIKGLGNEAEKLGVVLNEDQVEALVKVEHEMNKFFALIKAIGATIGAYFAPSLETAIKEFLKFYEVNKKLIDVNIKTWVWDVTYALGYVWGIVKFVTEAFLKFAKALHIDKYIGTAIFAFGAYVAALFAFSKALELAGGAVSIFTWSLSPLGGALKVVRGLMSLLAARILPLFVGETAAAAASTAILEAPLWLVALAATALVVGIHDLWKVLTGGSFKDTWIGQMVAYIKSIEGIGTIINSLISLFEKFKGASVLGNIAGFAGKLFSGLGGIDALNNVQNITNLGQAGGAGATSASNSYSVNAPISISVPAGVDHKAVGQKVKEGVKEHLDRVYREAQRSLRPAKAY